MGFLWIRPAGAAPSRRPDRPQEQGGLTLGRRPDRSVHADEFRVSGASAWIACDYAGASQASSVWGGARAGAKVAGAAGSPSVTSSLCACISHERHHAAAAARGSQNVLSEQPAPTGQPRQAVGPPRDRVRRTEAGSMERVVVGNGH